jgi:hypothetical protein
MNMDIISEQKFLIGGVSKLEIHRPPPVVYLPVDTCTSTMKVMWMVGAEISALERTKPLSQLVEVVVALQILIMFLTTLGTIKELQEEILEMGVVVVEIILVMEILEMLEVLVLTYH